MIHVESTLGFNIMLYAEFDCTEYNDSNDSVKVNGVKFYSYPMSGLISFGILDVKFETEPYHNFRIIKILMGANGNNQHDVDLTNENIVWKYDEIVDNKISFEVKGHVYTRDTLAASHPMLDDESNTSFFSPLIPVGGRPCQFRLVKE
ncbi:hypothetical protein Q2T41_09375 [Maribacter confluentis]|uniref:Uncharacterized protein n=1 Tax=Maribacter confluentis TaxID=1656093 RepID=A0ABT8RR58_9FLAO|nr:hypothetical protein [Maribacter confluentis]MDO1512864.1 hypothetical protein [Maribacter confluentis]